MLRMSKLTDYGTVVMTYLAREPNRLHAANEIAAEIQVSAPTVSKIRTAARRGVIPWRARRGTSALWKSSTPSKGAWV
jgi:Mn-dependent DtxR family transcriptional regulator